MKIFLILIIFITQINSSLAWWLKDSMLPTTNNQIWVNTNSWTWAINNILIFIKDFIFTILWIIVVGVFLYFWFKLITARWNPEEMKNTLVAFVYAIVWLAIIPLAYALVKIITTYKF